VAAQIVAVETLVEAGEIEEGDVALLFVVGEEYGGDGMKAANQLGLSWEAVIFGEPTELRLARGHKGVTGFTIRAKGKAGHSGYPEQGRNAIDILVQTLSALQHLELPSSRRYGNTTINIGTIEGGVVANVIPEDAFATASVRIASGTPEQIRNLVREALARVSPYVEVVFRPGIGPVPIDYDIEGENLIHMILS
jgi:acetylornithine deacetylase